MEYVRKLLLIKFKCYKVHKEFLMPELSFNFATCMTILCVNTDNNLMIRFSLISDGRTTIHNLVHIKCRKFEPLLRLFKMGYKNEGLLKMQFSCYLV